MKNTFLVAFFFLFFSLSAITQPRTISDPYLKYTQISKKNGLTGNYILDFLQDRQGYLWIATTTGLNRYDGFSVVQFQKLANDSTSISDNIVTCLSQLNDSIILVGTRSGLNFFNTSDQTFSRFDQNFPETALLANQFIRAILTAEMITWVETGNGELVKLNFLTKEIRQYKHKAPSMINTYFYHRIVKDKTGKLLLAGRYMGLFQFDPETEKFKHINTDPENPTKKRDNDAAVFFIDSQGEYWVGGIDGLYTFDPQTEIFEKHLSISTFDIIEPHPGEFWIATGSGLFRYFRDNKTFVQSNHNDNIRHSLAHNHINKLYIDQNRNIWIGTLNGVSIYQPSQNKFRHIYHIPENASTPVSNHISAIAEDHHNRIWIGTENEGLDCFDPYWNRLYHFSANSTGETKLASNAISTLMVDDENDIWVGQWSGRGFNILNPDKNSSKTHMLLKNELKADWYHDFLQDNSGKFWVGIWGAQGLYQFDKTKGVFLNERYIATPPILDKSIHALAFDGENIWLAVKNQSRFYCFNPKTEKLSFYSYKHYHNFNFQQIDSIKNVDNELYFFTNNGTYQKTGDQAFDFVLTENSIEIKIESDTAIQKDKIAFELKAEVFSVVMDTNKNVWVATNKGLYKTTDNLPVARYHVNDGKSAAMLSDTILALVFQEPDWLWLGTKKGLVKFSIPEKTFTNFYEQQSKHLSSHLIKFIFEDASGNLWIGTTNNGVNKIEKPSGNIAQYKSNMNEEQAFWGNEATCMAEDLNGDLWIGGFGLNKFNSQANRFSHLTQENGLADNQVMAILCDQNNRLWISTANGLSCFNPADSSFVNYFEKDGLQDNEFSAAASKLQNGQLLFGGKNGINVIDPNRIPVNSTPPKVSLSGFSIFEEPQQIKPNANEIIRLKYNQNYFSFSFVALDFSNPSQNKFRYKLENFDENWVDATAQNRVARYTNVDPGKYTFHVRAANSDGIWSESGISIPIIIKPPFWQTTLFYLFIGLILILLIYSWMKYRERQIREQNQFLILEQKLLRSQMNPHFIFNSLSSIQSFIFENNPVVAGSYLSRFAELIRSILYNSREEFITLEKEIKTLQNYLELQQLRFQNKFKYELSIDPEIEPETINIPPMLAQPFIENAIEHGLNDLDREGLLKIELLLQTDNLIIRVADNGPGIEATKKQKSQIAKEHQSLATVITNERIQVLNKGRKKQLYSIKISDLSQKSENASGTLVELGIPLIND